MSPAVVASSSSPGSSKADMKGHARKTRVVRRRGRGRLEGLESDDEIERAAMSDGSDTDDTLESDLESDSEAESTMQTNGHISVVTPSTTQSPPPIDTSKAVSPSSADPPRSAPAFFSASDNNWVAGGGADWSEMVADEGANGTAQLPVIDFADLDKAAVDLPTPPKEDEKGDSRVDEEVEVEQATAEEEDVPSGTGEGPRRGSARGTVPRRALGHAVRQQYQQRLQSDPSFVPTVGEFWGHDPRLIPEDMRPMSDWWRDRKFARGRGRGMMASRGFRGRGRGGFNGPVRSFSAQSREDESAAQDSPASPDMPSIDRAWTHDGFEEMKRREEKRRAEYQQKQKPVPFQRRGDVSPASNSSRGGFVPGRGRGAFIPGRGGFHNRRGAFSPNGLRPDPDRIWYAMKPERTWTKQLESFLHFDGTGKPWSNKPPVYKVRLPGKRSDFVRAPTAPQRSITAAEVRSQAHSDTASATEREKTYNVRLPKFEAREAVTHEPLTTVEHNLFDESPRLTASKANAYTEGQRTTAPSAPVSPIALRSAPSHSNSLPIHASEDTVSTPGLTRENSVSEASVLEPQSSIPPEQEFQTEEELRVHPELAPLQTVFPPPNQPSPTYSSPYGYPPQLPPGVALTPQGYPYEIASGRPVYLQPTPPPPVPLYNPRPMSHHSMHHTMPYMPGHMHHASVTPDFMPIHPHTPPVNGYMEPQMGAPLFSLPRQTGRVEIRAPSDSGEGVKSKGERKPSGLRNSTVNGEASADTGSAHHHQASDGSVMYAHAPEYYPNGLPSSQSYPATQESAGSPGSDGAHMQQPLAMDPSVMAYGGYQPYYYTDYGYGAYMAPHGQYDPYAGDPNQPTVYY